MTSALAPRHLLVLAVCAPERMPLLPGSPLSLAMPTGPETRPRQAVPSNLTVRAAMRPLLRGQLSSGWLPRGPTYAGNCIAELGDAQDSQWSLHSDLPASSIGLRERRHAPGYADLGWTPQ